MIDLIEQIGPYLGIAAFVALAILAFLIFQQAREIRRLRDWAGRAPERAEEAAEASLATAEARGDALEQEARAARGPSEGRFGGVRDRFAGAYDGLDRRMPFDPRYLLVPLLAIVIAAAVLTSGFGLVGGDDGGNGNRKGGGKGDKKEKPEKVEVAVLNATQGDVGLEAVPGLAGRVADGVVKPAGFKVGVEADAPDGFPESVVMFDASDAANEEQADKLAGKASEQLGEIPVEEMSGEIEGVAKGAPVALVIGADDAEF